MKHALLTAAKILILFLPIQRLFAQCPEADQSTDPSSHPEIYDWRTRPSSINMSIQAPNTCYSTPTTTLIENPFNAAQSPNVGNFLVNPFLSNPDYEPAKGWEMIHYDFGNNNATTVNYTKFPHIFLYNKKKGILRVFIFLVSADPSYQNVTITLTHVPTYGIQHVESALLSAAIQPQKGLIDDPVANANNDNYQGFEKKIIWHHPNVADNGCGQWLYADYEMTYDPCTCGHDSRIYVGYSLVHEYDLQLNGISQADIHESTGGTSGTTGSIHNPKESVAITTGELIKGAGEVFTNLSDFFEAKNNIAEKTDKPGVTQNEFKMLGAAFSGTGNALSFIGGVWNLFSALSGSNDGESSTVNAVDYKINLSGSLNSQSPYGPQTIGTPGLDPSTVAAVQLPKYNYNMGLANLLETPKVRILEYTPRRNYIRAEATNGQYDDFLLPRIYEAFIENNIKPLVNPASGYSLQDTKVSLEYYVGLPDFFYTNPFDFTYFQPSYPQETERSTSLTKHYVGPYEPNFYDVRYEDYGSRLKKYLNLNLLFANHDNIDNSLIATSFMPPSLAPDRRIKFFEYGGVDYAASNLTVKVVLTLKDARGGIFYWSRSFKPNIMKYTDSELHYGFPYLPFEDGHILFVADYHTPVEKYGPEIYLDNTPFPEDPLVRDIPEVRHVHDIHYNTPGSPFMITITPTYALDSIYIDQNVVNEAPESFSHSFVAPNIVIQPSDQGDVILPDGFQLYSGENIYQHFANYSPTTAVDIDWVKNNVCNDGTKYKPVAASRIGLENDSISKPKPLSIASLQPNPTPPNTTTTLCLGQEDETAQIVVYSSTGARANCTVTAQGGGCYGLTPRGAAGVYMVVASGKGGVQRRKLVVTE